MQHLLSSFFLKTSVPGGDLSCNSHLENEKGNDQSTMFLIRCHPWKGPVWTLPVLIPDSPSSPHPPHPAPVALRTLRVSVPGRVSVPPPPLVPPSAHEDVTTRTFVTYPAPVLQRVQRRVSPTKGHRGV